MREAIVTSAFSTSARAGDLAFLPNAESPWSGLIVTALVTGGIDVFNVDGLEVMSTSGPQLTTLTAIPAFPLRGEVFPMLFGADLDGRLRSYAVVRSAEDLFELPLESEDLGFFIAGTCLVDEGIGYFDLALLGEGDEARLVRVRDTGGEGLTVSELRRLSLPFPARNCAGAEDGLLVSAPSTGVARVSLEGQTEAVQTGIRVDDVVYTQLLGRPVALTVSAQSGQMSAFDARSLDPIVDLVLVDGLGAPGFQSPSGLAVTDQNFGGMAFSSGIFAVYDRGDDRVKLVAREVVSRAVITPET